MKYSIWYNFDFKLVDKLKELCDLHNLSIDLFEFYTSNPELYWSLPRNNHLGNYSFLDHIKYIKKSNFTLVYVLNLPVLEIELIIPVIDNLINRGITEFTIADFKIVKYILKKYWKLVKINISTVARIHKIIQIKRLIDDWLNINKIILSHSCNSSIDELSFIIRFTNANNIIIELVWNELVNCNNCLDLHPCLIYGNFLISWFGWWNNLCDSIYENLQYLLKYKELSIIRPEDINYYENIWLSSIKIATRKWINTDKVINIITSYINKAYIWNLFYLMWDQWLNYKGSDFRNSSLYIKNDITKSFVSNWKLILDIWKNFERLDFIKYFSNNKYYKWIYKSYFDFRLEEYKFYEWYITSNFSSKNKFDIVLRNNLILNYLKIKIPSYLYEKVENIIKYLNYEWKYLQITYWWFNSFYRLYFQSENIEIIKMLWFNITDLKNIHLIWIDLAWNIERIKIYKYLNKEYFPDKGLLKELELIWNIGFILEMKEYQKDNYNFRLKYYFSFNNWIEYNHQKLFLGFEKCILDFWLNELFINYITVDKNTWKQQIYFTDLNNNNISNDK
jgi:hypothetical protein